MTALYFREYNVSKRVVDTRANLMRRKGKTYGPFGGNKVPAVHTGIFSAVFQQR